MENIPEKWQKIVGIWCETPKYFTSEGNENKFEVEFSPFMVNQLTGDQEFI